MTKLFANGCFDIVHEGHVNLLKQASKLGILYVGLNTDESVKKLKGVDRPKLTFKERKDKLIRLVPDIIRVSPIWCDEDIINFITSNNIDFIVKGSDTLADKKYEKVIGSDKCHGVIYIQHHIMDIHTKDLI